MPDALTAVSLCQATLFNGGNQASSAVSSVVAFLTDEALGCAMTVPDNPLRVCAVSCPAGHDAVTAASSAAGCKQHVDRSAGHYGAHEPRARRRRNSAADL